MRTLRITILLVLAILAAGCQRASRTPTSAQAVPAVSQATTPKVAHYCGARTREGKACTRRVKSEGLRCWQHAEQQ